MCKFVGGQTFLRNESIGWDTCTSSRPISRQRFEFEHIYQDPKDGELCLNRTNSEETLMEVRIDTDVQIVRHTWVQGRKTNRTIQQLVPSEVSLRIAGVAQFYQVKRMIRGIGDALSSTYSQTLNG